MDFEQDGEKLLLMNVTRADSGTYLCEPLDSDIILEQQKGKTELQVHCECCKARLDSSSPASPC